MSFGKGDGAGYYANMMDYSETLYFGGGAWYTLYSSGISFVDDNGNKLYRIGETNGVFNAVGRQERIRYDSPSIGGLVLSTSLDNGNAYELAARYHVDFPGAKLATGLSWLMLMIWRFRPRPPMDSHSPLGRNSKRSKSLVLRRLCCWTVA